MQITRDEIVTRIQDHAEELRLRFSVENLSLFGSASRGEVQKESDIDVLVSFSGPATFRGYFGLKSYLESLLGYPVDLVSEKALRPELRPHIEKDIVRVA
ncbi:MAG: nucleotidyltransferase family protein [Candidatus Hydrogenedentes bacterium]|nr:nucleotidyltransferase family protein [Candidatus Hydrogenedentota bacterium]MBI3119313.1 nucleotidyltransferase family protein [Candidatus Hydrogenedentota bacterium]